MSSGDGVRSTEAGTRGRDRQRRTDGATAPAAHTHRSRPDAEEEAEPHPAQGPNQQQGQGEEPTVVGLNVLAMGMSEQGRLMDAETTLRRALDLCPPSAGRGLERAVCLENLATCVSDQGRLAEAGYLYWKALDLLRSSGADAKSQARCRMNQALCLFAWGRGEDAEDLGRSAMRQYRGNGRPEVRPVGQRTGLQDPDVARDANLPHMLLNLAFILHESDLDASQSLNTEALEIFEGRPHNERFQARCLANLASCAHRRNDPEASRTLYGEAMALLADPEKDRRFLADCSVNRAHLLLEENEFGDAMRLATSAYTTYHVSGLVMEEMTTGALIGSILLSELEFIDDPEQVEKTLDRALPIALNAALNADHLRYQFDNEAHRLKWMEATAAPVLSLGLLVAARRGDAALVSDLIATWRMSGSLETLPWETTSPETTGGRGRITEAYGAPLRAGVPVMDLVREGGVSPAPDLLVPMVPHATGPDTDARGQAEGGAHVVPSDGIRRQAGPVLLMPYQNRRAMGRWSGEETRPSARYR